MLLALGLVTACTLAFQVVFTRMLASVLAYHFSFLAISLALLGTGAGALLIYVRPSWFDGVGLEAMLARWALAYGALLILTPLALVRLDYNMADGVTTGFALNLAICCVLAAAPALAAGAVVALAIRGYADDVGRVYAWDLVGAGLARWRWSRCSTFRHPTCWWRWAWWRAWLPVCSPGRTSALGSAAAPSPSWACSCSSRPERRRCSTCPWGPPIATTSPPTAGIP
ncbi:MAG: hypothetical protein ACRDZN_17160 [Acidimicrobiales bacterium]